MDFAEQVKSSVDIVKVIEEYVRLKKAGGSPRYTGLCPFHSEKRPSFSVHSTLQIYKCFSCGASGDLFKFVMEIERISFFEALKLVAERNGMAMPKREYSDPDAKLRGALMEMHETAARAFQNNLNGPAGAQEEGDDAQEGRHSQESRQRTQEGRCEEDRRTEEGHWAQEGRNSQEGRWA